MFFRQASPEDVPIIVGLLADDPLGREREDFSDPLPDCYLQAFLRIHQDPNQELMVMVDQMEIVATLQLSFIPYLTYRGGIRAQIEAVRVRKDRRGAGLGQEIFAWAIQRAQEKKAHVLQLTTDKKRPDAIRFYEKLGFVPSHEGMKLHFGKD